MLTDKKSGKLPDFFKPLFWSYDFNSLDTERNKKTIIINSINYGSLKHWRWLKNYYGNEAISKILRTMPATEFKKRAGKLAETLFGFQLNYAPRSTH